MSAKGLEIEVTLARNLKVGPKGGERKAGSNVTLPATEARLLLMRGDARRADAKQPATIVPVTPPAEETE